MPSKDFNYLAVAVQMTGGKWHIVKRLAIAAVDTSIILDFMEIVNNNITGIFFIQTLDGNQRSFISLSRYVEVLVSSVKSV